MHCSPALHPKRFATCVPCVTPTASFILLCYFPAECVPIRQLLPFHAAAASAVRGRQQQQQQAGQPQQQQQLQQQAYGALLGAGLLHE
jgi:hypothetical protein